MDNARDAMDEIAKDDASANAEAEGRREEGKSERKGFSLRDGLSIDEAKVSALILCTLCDFALVAFCMVSQGDITDNHLYLFQTLIAAVAGVNIAERIGGLFTKKKG